MGNNNPNICSAVYRLANETEFHFVTGEASSVENIEDCQGFIFTDFNRINSFLIQPDTSYSGSWEELKSKIDQQSFSPKSNSEDESTPRDDYDFGFTIVQNEIDYKKISKAILSRKMVFNASTNTTQLFEDLANNYSDCHIYMVQVPNGDIWVGASPETLIEGNKELGTTMSLAGTKKDKETDWTEKEYSEQQIVTQTIKNALLQMDIQPEIHELETVKAGAVFHLRNVFSFPTIKHSIAEIAEKLHPTPAISGSPKEQAISTIKIAENHNREFYCGFGGPIQSNGKSTLFVNLRCAKITSNQTILFVGGGITKKSVLEDEWKECERKAQSLLCFL